MEKVNYQLVKLYQDVVKEGDDINAWSTDSCFSVRDLSFSQKQSLTKVNGLEVVFQGAHGNSELIGDRFDKYELFVRQFIIENNLPAYLIKVEHKASPRNRIRSYKGVVPKEIDKKNFIELEISVEGNMSLILAMIIVNEYTITKIFNSFYDSTNSFVLLTSKKVFSKEFVQEVFERYVQIDRTANLNYINLICDFCGGEDLILRSAGDGGDSEINLQMFGLCSRITEIYDDLKI